MTGAFSTLAFLAGLVGVFLGERVLGVGTGRAVCSGLGVASVAIAVGWRAARLFRAQGARRSVERWGLGLLLLGVTALALYFLQADVGAALLGDTLARRLPRAVAVVRVLVPVLLVLSVLPLVLMELSVSAMRRAPVLELGRVQGALFSGLGLAFALIFAFSAQYTATRVDVSWDLSYFRVARPGEATRKLVQGINEPLQVTLFFPPANGVGEAVQQYFRDLGRDAPHLQVERLDHAVEVARARALGVGANGTLVLARGEMREPLTLGTDLERARGLLLRLDAEVLRRLMTVARPRRVVYFTTGHGERGDGRPVEGEAERPGISALKELLRARNVDVRTLGLAEGLGTEVPRDASVVVAVGPTREFLPEEVGALREYVERGGRLWLALEPEGPSFEALLAPLGLKYLRTSLANDETFLRMSRQKSDRGSFGVADFSSHPSVSTVARLGGQVPVAFLGTGAFEPLAPPSGVTLDVTVRAPAATFDDPDGDFTFGPGESRRGWPLVVVAEKTFDTGTEPARVVAMADADVLCDRVLPDLGNAYLATGALRWLTGEEALAGAVSSEEDLPLQHTRAQDVAWFYASVFVVPGLVLGTGFFVTRRRGRRSSRAVAPVVGGSP
ncbi:Gldg family protein [Myxococcaceae bacterium GXIMD 01537]